jgi:hypothetical protein
MVIKYPKRLLNIPNGHKMYQYLPMYGPPKFTQIGIFGMKRNHLATLRQTFVALPLKQELEEKECF